VVTFLNSHSFIFEILIFPTMSKTFELGQKTQEILVDNVHPRICFHQISNNQGSKNGEFT
jgi:hypothetical protein